ncbi:phosphoglycerate kinase [Candidatus Parcubacteria bacterium]|nr:phosphoglycerate kinase [Candidatus Parcubacteria bacterium]
MQIKTIKKLPKISGQVVLLRSDFNVPIEHGIIKDDFKIRKALPTLNYLINNGAKVVILTHLGRPKSAKDKHDLSTRPIAARLSKYLRKTIKHLDVCYGFEVEKIIRKMKPGQVILLENIRFEAGEYKNSKRLAKKLASIATYYVNDAFGVSHRNHASLSAIKNYLPSFAGLVVAEEIKHLRQILQPKKPLISMIGGVKLATKMPLIRKLSRISHRVLVGGGLANDFLAAHGLEIGKSISDKKSIALAKRIHNKKIILPLDVVVSSRVTKWRVRVVSVNKVAKNDYIFDIGPQTIKLYAKLIKQAKTILWNGPMGMFEDNQYKHGTLALAQVMAAHSTGKAFGVAGGGETVAALKQTKMLEHVDWVSTGGGAMLSFLIGEKMPGLKGLYVK